jgi:pyruvate kinase
VIAGAATGEKKRNSRSSWDARACTRLIAQLWSVRRQMLRQEALLRPRLRYLHPSYRASARNLSHYLALRRADRRPLQEQLARIGLSSLGRAESHVLANLDKVLGILHRLTEQPWRSQSGDEPVGINSSQALLRQHALQLLGPAPRGRTVRIMVTLPAEAATSSELVRQLVISGMDIARINCAHDAPAQWRAMAGNVRRAAQAEGRPVKVMMDVAGPKLRTGTINSGPLVLKLRPQRDSFGKVLAPAVVGLRAAADPEPIAGVPVCIGVDADWLAPLRNGDLIEFTDARGSHRTLRVTARQEGGALAECAQTAYLIPGTVLQRRRARDGRRLTRVSELPAALRTLRLQRGSRLRVVREDPVQAPPRDSRRGAPEVLPTISCTLPEVFGRARAGEHIWFDDGRIGGIIRRTGRDYLDVEITQARDTGSKLRADQGINLPDTELDLPALTAKDAADLATVAQIADLVGLSFVRSAADVKMLRSRLRSLGAPGLGIVLKIETRRAFERLPELLYAAMAGDAAGIMIARGDLAVECGYERLAEVQEEILWAAEAAHMPVIWATQVLETLAKTGLPSRAEITDAAMSERAECVMLNKGPYVTDAIRALDDILRRMQAHQSKKRPLLRALHAWD